VAFFYGLVWETHIAQGPPILKQHGTSDAIQILGLCRFSVPSFGAFQVTHDTIEARRAMLYDPKRLHARFTWFEHVFLPGIRAQTDPDFRLLVLVGNDLPEIWLEQLHGLVQDTPQIVIEFAPPWKHRAVCAKAMAKHIDPAAMAVAQFRLDDDDAVAVNFVERLRADTDRFLPQFQRDGLMAIDYARGIVLRHAAAGLLAEPVITRYWTPALAVITQADTEKFILDFRHHILWREMTSIVMQDEIMFVRGAHDTNDSAISPSDAAYDLPDADVALTLRDRFAINFAGLSRALAALRSS
jgi:hypothetical protein